MSVYWWFLVIFLTALVVIGGPAWWMGRRKDKRIPQLERTNLHARLEEGMGRVQLPVAGRFDADWWPDPGAGYRFAYLQPPYGPFPADTGPLLILSEKAAANAALEREIPRLCAEAEAKIPPRWR